MTHHKMHKKHKEFSVPGLRSILPERRVSLAQHRGDAPRRTNWPRENIRCNGWDDSGVPGHTGVAAGAIAQGNCTA
jgi:hypothetical protein